MGKKFPLHFSVSEKACDDLLNMSKRHKRSIVDIIRIGVGLAKIVLEELMKGNRIMIADKDWNLKKELIIP